MRILIATVTAGGGHLQAAAALEEAWKLSRPKDQVRKVDVLDFTPALYKKAYAEGYVQIIKRAPELYAALFRKTDNPSWVRKLTRLKRTLSRRSAPRFTRMLRAFKPHAVLAPHFLPLEILGGLKGKPGFDARIACVVTDFEAHALWLEPCVDDYFVAAQETKDRLVARGVPAEAVSVTGIPVAARFAGKTDRRAARRRQGLRDDLPTLLVLSGGFGMAPLAKTMAALDRLRTPVQTVVVAGRNEKLRAELAVQDRTHPTRVLGFTKEMHELMSIADLILTKPGGLTTSEALALGRPLVVLDPIPGQEAANSDFLLERGAAAKVNRMEDLPARLDRLLGSKKLKEMTRAARSLGRPHAARDICRAMESRLRRTTAAAAAVAMTAAALASPASAGPKPLHKLLRIEQRERLNGDMESVLRYRSGLADVVAFQDSRPELFPAEAPPGDELLVRGRKEEVWRTWQRFLDYMLALDAIRGYYGGFYRLRGATRTRALRIRYAAFLAQYRWAMEFIERAERDPRLDTVLDDAVPELGLPEGTYAKLKFRYLHVARAAEFAAMEALYKTTRREERTELTTAIEADAAYVWKFGKGKGGVLTAKNALKVVKDKGHKAWMPVQSGVADQRLRPAVRRAGGHTRPAIRAGGLPRRPRAHEERGPGGPEVVQEELAAPQVAHHRAGHQMRPS